MLHEFLRRLWYYLNRRRFEAELDEEMRHHLALKERDSGSLGSAHRQFGNVTLLKEESRAMWAWTFSEQLVQDLRYAVRTAIHNRAFTVLAVLSLALGIGANTAIYSFMDAILLRSLPVSDPGSLVVLNWHVPKNSRPSQRVHRRLRNERQHLSRSATGTHGRHLPVSRFRALAQERRALLVFIRHSIRPAGLTLTTKGQAELANGEYVSGDYFRGAGVPPAVGRLLLPDDDRVGAPPVVVISHAFSERRFGGPANAAGQPILVNSVPFTVAGIVLYPISLTDHLV